jgi:hypothetical protein
MSVSINRSQAASDLDEITLGVRRRAIGWPRPR